MLMIFFKTNDIKKITIKNSVKYIAQSEQTQKRDIKPKTIQKNLLTREQDRNISQNNKNFIKNIAAEGFGILEGAMNC